jgi:hypothetical protein
MSDSRFQSIRRNRSFPACAFSQACLIIRMPRACISPV